VFDGQDISVQVSSLTTDEGSLSQNFVYVPVGTRLTVRPHVTQQNQVKLNVNLLLSRVAGGSGSGNPTFDRRETTTHVTVQDGQTVMLSGITRQEEFKEVRKLPLLGDLPGIGGLFRNTDTSLANRELVVFLTPEVLQADPKAVEDAMDPYQNKLQQMRRELRNNDVKSSEPTPWNDNSSGLREDAADEAPETAEFPS
jgi:type II secretory pathway component GspD/PulD (secretin)